MCTMLLVGGSDLVRASTLSFVYDTMGREVPEPMMFYNVAYSGRAASKDLYGRQSSPSNGREGVSPEDPSFGVHLMTNLSPRV